MQGVGTPAERAVDRGPVTPQLRRGDSVTRTPTGPAGARVCDFTPEVWLILPSPVLRGWSGCTWHGRVAASDDRSRLRGRGSPKPASSRPVWDPDFNGALFFPGTVLTYQTSLCVHECGEVWRAVFLQKEGKKSTKKNHNNKVACVRAVFGVPCPYSPDPVTTPARASVSLVFKEG